MRVMRCGDVLGDFGFYELRRLPPWHRVYIGGGAVLVRVPWLRIWKILLRNRRLGDVPDLSGRVLSSVFWRHSMRFLPGRLLLQLCRPDGLFAVPCWQLRS